jgi:hypothetical protein
MAMLEAIGKYVDKRKVYGLTQTWRLRNQVMHATPEAMLEYSQNPSLLVDNFSKAILELRTIRGVIPAKGQGR